MGFIPVLVQVQSWTPLQKTTVRKTIGGFAILTNMKEKSDVSYGVIPVRREKDEWRVFLIHQYSSHTGDSYWVFPKGHAETGESPIAAARRELQEETGLVPASIDANRPYTIEYSFSHAGYRINKRVEFFLAIIGDSQYELQVAEVREGGWFSLAAARERLTHEQPKQVLDAVADELAANY